MTIKIKRASKLFLVGVLVLFTVGCSTDETIIQQRKAEIEKLETDIVGLEEQRLNLEDIATELKVEKGVEKYVITINISQSHISLDIGKHIKNAMNDIDIQLPVDKEFYESVEIGSVINDSFRMGSFVMNGSFGNWKIKITDKRII